MNGEPIPGTLFHYTSNAAFLSILSGQELWFSDVRFLNDAKEFQHACEMLQNSIEKVAGQWRTIWLERGCDPGAFDQMVANMRGKISDAHLYRRVASPFYVRGVPPLIRQFSTLIFSLTEYSDSLSQWRAYGNGEYCLGFDTGAIREIPGVRLIKISYTKRDECVDEACETVDRFFDNHLSNNIQPNGSIDSEVFHDGADDVIYDLRNTNFFYRYKHNGFSEEKEWRMLIDINVLDERLFFDRDGRYPRPRAKIRIDGVSKIITDIVCGPGADRGRSEASLEMLKRHMGWYPLRTCFSKIPFRAE